MAGEFDKREQEHKQRVKKLKARTSKMRVANKKKWNKMTDDQKKNTYSSYSGVSPEHVDLTGMEYSDLPKHVKKGVNKSA